MAPAAPGPLKKGQRRCPIFPSPPYRPPETLWPLSTSPRPARVKGGATPARSEARIRTPPPARSGPPLPVQRPLRPASRPRPFRRPLKRRRRTPAPARLTRPLPRQFVMPAKEAIYRKVGVSHTRWQKSPSGNPAADR